MDTLMIILLLTFTPIKGTDKVGVGYEVKPGVTSLAYCKKVEAVLKESPPKGVNAIVLCMPLQEPASAPATPPAKGREA